VKGQQGRVLNFVDVKRIEEAKRLEKLPVESWPLPEIVDGNGKRKRKCPWPHCERTGTCPSALKLHLYTHASESCRPFSCDEDGCNRGFVSSRDLRKHMKTHEPKACRYEDCHAILPNTKDLRLHVQDHEPNCGGLKLVQPKQYSTPCELKSSYDFDLNFQISLSSDDFENFHAKPDWLQLEKVGSNRK
jgi:hypothetical protein